MAKSSGKRQCSLVDCDRPHEGLGFCAKHYLRFKAHGDPMWRDGDYVLGRDPVCTVEDCERVHQARGFCDLHYQRFKTHGDPLITTRRNKGEGTIDRAGYVRLTVPPDTPGASLYYGVSQNGTRRLKGMAYAHRHVMAEHLGRPLAPGESVHHKNGDKTDNRIENLELWCSTQPSGQRVTDMLAWAHEIIDRYEDQGASEPPQSPADRRL